ncbi:hypothetical protein [Neobacillus sp. D3-1R]|uniref:hypothetical protein n=1 Tax=Neobacillus sp. D3-1R TaxID=3445778 RepID=UPI003FA0DAC2
MADLLLSMSAWMLISVTVLPIGVEFTRKYIDEREKFEALVILNEKLHEILVDGEIQPQQTITRNGKQYMFIPKIDTKEVCIEFEDIYKNKKTVCEFLE